MRTEEGSRWAGWRLIACGQAVVADYGRHAYTVVGEEFLSPSRLRLAMREMGTPSLDRLLVAPEGQRQNLTLDRQAGEPLDGDEAVDLLELRPERGGDVEVILVMVGLGLNLENYSVHGIRSEEHTSELQSLMSISYAVFCLKKK